MHNAPTAKRNSVKFGEIKASLKTYREAAVSLRDILLANTVMIGEIPAPTFDEEARVRFIGDRFSECGLEHCSIDEVGNGFGVLPGTVGERDILLVAHADTVFGPKVDHTISMQADRLIGPGVGDNSLGLALLATLPLLLKACHLELKSNVIMMAASRSQGRGNLAGLRFFLENHKPSPAGAICVEGVKLGRLSYASIGMLRGEIKVQVPETYDWTRFGADSALLTLNDVINRINQIRMPKRPRTNIVLGSVEAGNSFNNLPTQAVLRFEIRSESGAVVSDVLDEIKDRITQVELDTSAEITFDIVARRDPGGLDFRHPLVRRARDILKALEIEPRVAPSTSELAELIRHRVPAVTLGLTTGSQLNQVNEEVFIDPIFTGVAQVVGQLVAMDEGVCDGH